MNSIKTVVIVVVLAAVGYLVFVSISGQQETTPPPGAPQQAGDVPDVKLPEVGNEAYSASTPPTGNAAGGGEAPRFVPGQTPTVSMQGAGPPGNPSEPPDAGQTSVPPPPPSSPGTARAADPPESEPARAPEGEIREAFTKFIEAAYTELDTAFLRQDPRRLADVLEQLSKFRDKEDDQHQRHNRTDDRQKGRIGHRPGHAPLQFLLQLQEIGRPPQRILQKGTFRPGANHAHRQLTENMWMTGKRVVDRKAVGNSVADVDQHVRQAAVRCLFAQDVQRAKQRDSVFEQVGQLGERRRNEIGPNGSFELPFAHTFL